MRLNCAKSNRKKKKRTFTAYKSGKLFLKRFNKVFPQNLINIKITKELFLFDNLPI